MPRPRKNAPLTSRIEPDRPPVVADEAVFQARTDADPVDLHIAIASHLDMGSRLTPAMLEVMRAHHLAGRARIEPLSRAIKLIVAECRTIDPQFVVTAVAMVIVLPAWVGVILKCGGVL